MYVVEMSHSCLINCYALDIKLSDTTSDLCNIFA